MSNQQKVGIVMAAKKKTAKKTNSKSTTKKSNASEKKKVTAKENKKQAKPKEKTKTKTKTKKKKVDLDKFGFRKTSKKSQAAALYATKKGATLKEVTDKTGSAQLNLLKELEKKGFKIERKKEKGKGKKPVTRYRIDTSVTP